MRDGLKQNAFPVRGEYGERVLSLYKEKPALVTDGTGFKAGGQGRDEKAFRGF